MEHFVQKCFDIVKLFCSLFCERLYTTKAVGWGVVFTLYFGISLGVDGLATNEIAVVVIVVCSSSCLDANAWCFPFFKKT